MPGLRRNCSSKQDAGLLSGPESLYKDNTSRARSQPEDLAPVRQQEEVMMLARAALATAVLAFAASMAAAQTGSLTIQVLDANGGFMLGRLEIGEPANFMVL